MNYFPLIKALGYLEFPLKVQLSPKNDLDLSKKNISVVIDDRHSRIKFVTPNQRHDGLEIEILAKRKVLYQQKRNEYSERWSKNERNWQPIGDVK